MSSIENIVHDNLESAQENGAFEKGGYLRGFSAEEIAHDMVNCSADAEQFDPEELVPHVRTWMSIAGIRS